MNFFTWLNLEQKYTLLRLAIFFTSCGIILTGCMVYDNIETSHVVITNCRITDCKAYRNYTCYFDYNIEKIAYTCYDVIFGAYPITLNNSYTKYYSYDKWDIDHYKICINSDTIYCTYDDRNIYDSLSLQKEAAYEADKLKLLICSLISIMLFTSFLMVLAIMGRFPHTKN